MSDNVPVNQAERPAAGRAAPGADGAAPRPVDPAALGTAFPRTHHMMSA